MSNYPTGMTNHDFEMFEGPDETPRFCRVCKKITDHVITDEDRRGWGVWIAYECSECETTSEYDDVWRNP